MLPQILGRLFQHLNTNNHCPDSVPHWCDVPYIFINKYSTEKSDKAKNTANQQRFFNFVLIFLNGNAETQNASPVKNPQAR